jgi:hypothetical protein
MTDMTALAGWENFYVIVGSSAGALIGLQFVVITLIAGRPIAPGQAQAGDAFATPTIVHFGTELLLSAGSECSMARDRRARNSLGPTGLRRSCVAIIVTRRLRVQTVYQPQFEDWLFHALLPFAAYVTLAASAYAARAHAHEAMFGVAAAALLLLFIDIHNAWDAVTYHVFVKKGGREWAERGR